MLLPKTTLLKLIKPKPVRNLRLSARTETLTPVPLSYATYEDTTTDTKEHAPPLIILHGLFGSKANFNSLCKVYQQKTYPKRKIVAVDCRNHGDSPHSQDHTYAHMAVDVKKLLGVLNVDKCALLGHSMGGRAVMLFALKYPELVERLIVADISPVTRNNLETMPQILAALEGANLPENVTLSQARKDVDKQLAKTIDNQFVRQFLLTNLVQSDDGKKYKWRVNIPVLLSNFNNISKFPTTDSLKYTGPTLFLAGEHSDYIHKEDVPKIKELFPKAELEVISGAGHWLHSEKPYDFLDLTLAFLNDN